MNIQNQTIREFKNTDKEELLALSREFSNFFPPLNKWGKTPIDPITPSYYLDKLIAEIEKSGGNIFIAFVNNKMVGFIGFYFREQTYEEKLEMIHMKIGHVSAFFITEKLRSQKIGEKLLEKAHQYFKNHGCTHVELEVFAPNVKAHNFYLKHGYDNKNIQMIKTL